MYNPPWLKLFLQDCFPGFDLANINDINDIHGLIDDLLAAEEHGYLIEDQKLSQLAEMFPDCDIKVLQEVIEAFPDDPVEQLADSVIAFKDHFIRTKNDLKQRKPNFHPISDRFKETLNILPAQCSYADAVVAQKINSKNKCLRFTYDFGPKYDESITDVQLLRQIIARIQTKRRELYLRAAQAYHKSNLTGTHAASYYSMQANELGTQLSSVFAQLAQVNFDRNNPECFDKVDLHGLTINQAMAVTAAFVKFHGDLDECVSVQVVTGVGFHSLDGARLKPSIEKLLGNMQCAFSWEYGFFRVHFNKQSRRRS